MWQQPGGWNQPQWPIQQSAYANMAHNQVDWAALAKQWMQFRDVGDVPIQAPPPPPPPIPPSNTAISSQPPPTALDSGSARNWSGSWNDQSGGSKPAWGNAPPSSDWPSSVDPLVLSQNGSSANPPTSIDYNHGEAQQSSSGSALQENSVSSSVHQFNAGYDYGGKNYHEQQQQNYWMDQGYSNHFYDSPSGDSGSGHGGVHHSSMHADQQSSHSFSGVRLPFIDTDVIDPTPTMDAAKRKALPAWIREGLEKMEREKAKKEEQARLVKEAEERRRLEEEELKKAEEEEAKTGIPRKSKFDDDDDDDDGGNLQQKDEEEEDEGKETRQHSAPPLDDRGRSRTRSPSPTENYMTPEERHEVLIKKVKAMVTDILLSVTSEEIESVCSSVYNKYKQKQNTAPARMIAKSSALASLKNSFGGYDSEISEEEKSSAENSDSDKESNESSDVEHRLQRRRDDFSRRQRDRLRQLEIEEKHAMDLFNKVANSSFSNNSSSIPGLEASDIPPVKHEKNSEDRRRGSKDIDSEMTNESLGGSRRDSKDEKQVVKERSRSPDRNDRNKRSRSRSHERKRSRSRERERRRSKDRGSYSREKRHSRYRSQSREKKSRSRSRSREKRRRSHRSKSRERHRDRSRSSDRRKRSRSRERKHKHRSRSKERKHDRDHRSTSRDRTPSTKKSKSSRHESSSDSERKRDRSRSESREKRKSRSSRHSKSESSRSSHRSSRKYSTKKHKSSSDEDSSTDD